MRSVHVCYCGQDYYRNIPHNILSADLILLHQMMMQVYIGFYLVKLPASRTPASLYITSKRAAVIILEMHKKPSNM